MAISKVVYNDTTLIDISNDTVTRDKLAYGYTAHDRSGNRIVGTADMDGAGMIPTKVSDLENDLDFIQNGTTDDVTLKDVTAEDISSDSVTTSELAVADGGFLKVITLTASGSANANSRLVSLNQVVDAGTGWSPIGLVGAYSSMTTFSIYRAYTAVVDGEFTAIVGARYLGDNTSSTNVTLRAYVLCARTSL